MDQRIESFLADVLEDPDAMREGARRSGRLRGALPSARAEQADEGQGRSRLPRAVPRSRDRGYSGAGERR
jgi:hypothetical protein